MEEIKNKNSLAQREYGDDASRTMQCDQIEEGLIISTKSLSFIAEKIATSE